MKFLKSFSVIALLAVCGVQPTLAQWTYSSSTATGDCSALPANLSTGFAVTPLISPALFTATAPIRINKMTFWLNPTSGKADIYMNEKGGNGTAGRVLYYNATANTLTAIGTIPNVYIGFQEDGVVGIALNPKTFAEDNFLYFMYSYGTSATPSATNGFRIVRYKINPTTKMMNMASEKILIHIPAGTANRWHKGGVLQFDGFGNLYITVGDNESQANGPSNTANLRGGILRITPDTTVSRGYTIPAGNFGDYWAQQWDSQNLTARAAAYRDTAIVKPELYVKGSRNPYGFSTDKTRLGLIAWSECGPDVQRAEEYNLATHPVFSGWPFCAGNAVRQAASAGSYDEANEPNSAAQWAAFNPTSMTTAVPVNNWASATGYDTLPPMHVPTYTEPNGCAQGGAIIRYDGSINSPGKMPPHLDNVVMYTNLSNNNYYAVKFNPTTGANVGTVQTVFTSLSKATNAPNLGTAIDLQQGPDGALYSLNWGAGCCNGDRPASAYEGIARITYTGTCQDPGLTTKAIAEQEAMLRSVKMDAQKVSILANGGHEIQVFDMGGRTVFSLSAQGKKEYSLRQLVKGRNGVYVLRIKTAEGSLTRKVPFFGG